MDFFKDITRELEQAANSIDADQTDDLFALMSESDNVEVDQDLMNDLFADSLGDSIGSEVVVDAPVINETQAELVAVQEPEKAMPQAEELPTPEAVMPQAELPVPEAVIPQAEELPVPETVMPQAEELPVPETVIPQAEELPVPEAVVPQVEELPVSEAVVPQAEELPVSETIVPEAEEESMLEPSTVPTAQHPTEKSSMFSTDLVMPAENWESQSDAVTVITKGTVVNGSITSDGSLEVMGTVNGNIECLGKLTISGKVTGSSLASDIVVTTDRLDASIVSKGSVTVGAGTVIIGNITATSANFAGAIKGEIDVKGPVILDSTAVIKGNIKAKSIKMNNGAVVDGFCSLCYANLKIDHIFD